MSYSNKDKTIDPKILRIFLGQMHAQKTDFSSDVTAVIFRWVYRKLKQTGIELMMWDRGFTFIAAAKYFYIALKESWAETRKIFSILRLSLINFHARMYRYLNISNSEQERKQ